MRLLEMSRTDGQTFAENSWQANCFGVRLRGFDVVFLSMHGERVPVQIQDSKTRSRVGIARLAHGAGVADVSSIAKQRDVDTITSDISRDIRRSEAIIGIGAVCFEDHGHMGVADEADLGGDAAE